MSTFAVVSDDLLAELMAGSREKGAYGRWLVEFFDSGEKAICVNDTWAALKNKKAMTVTQGFKNAAKTAEVTNLRVISKDNKVFLLNTDLVNVAETE